MPTELRHVQMSSDPQELCRQVNDNAVDTNHALAQKISGHLVLVSAYMATGATTTKIPLPTAKLSTGAPMGILLLRAYPTSDPAADTPTVGRVNFSQQGESLFAFEPSGLVANRMYDLTFMVVEEG